MRKRFRNRDDHRVVVAAAIRRLFVNNSDEISKKKKKKQDVRRQTFTPIVQYGFLYTSPEINNINTDHVYSRWRIFYYYFFSQFI